MKRKPKILPIAGFDDEFMRDNNQVHQNMQSIIRLAQKGSFENLHPNFFIPCDGFYYKGDDKIAKELAHEILDIVPSHNFLNNCYKALHAALFASDEIQEWECVEQL